MVDQNPAFEISTDSGTDSVKIKGATDNTLIGNDGDKLKTTAEVTFPASQFPAINSNFRVIDMNASNGGVARGTTITTSWTTVYSYSGTGHLFGFSINFSSGSGFKIRIAIDNIEILNDSTGISTTDTNTLALYDLNDVDNDEFVCSMFCWDNVFAFRSPLPIEYSTSVVIRVARETGTGTFRAGLINITKN